MRYYKIIGAAMALIFTACSVQTPPNNALDKGHEDPARITFKFTPGTLAKPEIEHKSKLQSGTDHSPKKQLIYADGFSPIPDGQISTMEVTGNEEGKVVMNGDIRLKKGVWYKLEIFFYNHSGALINPQFIRNEEQRNMHQFFFQPFIQPTPESEKSVHKEFITYKYGDKFADGSLIMPPVGFVGYIKVREEAPERFKLHTKLVHLVPPTTKLSRTGKPYHYDEPERLGTPISDIDMNITINVVE